MKLIKETSILLDEAVNEKMIRTSPHMSLNAYSLIVYGGINKITDRAFEEFVDRLWETFQSGDTVIPNAQRHIHDAYRVTGIAAGGFFLHPEDIADLLCLRNAVLPLYPYVCHSVVDHLVFADDQ
jgi:hypothetical protein